MPITSEHKRLPKNIPIRGAAIFLIFATLLTAAGYSLMSSKAALDIADYPYTVRTPDRTIRVDRTHWEKMSDEQAYAKNFIAKLKSSEEAYEQVMTIFLIPFSQDRKSGVPISKNEWLEMFKTSGPERVTVQIRADKGDCWLLSRQTFLLTDPALIQSNPELSADDFELFRSSLQDQIDSTRYLMQSEF